MFKTNALLTAISLNSHSFIFNYSQLSNDLGDSEIITPLKMFDYPCYKSTVMEDTKEKIISAIGQKACKHWSFFNWVQFLTIATLEIIYFSKDNIS